MSKPVLKPPTTPQQPPAPDPRKWASATTADELLEALQQIDHAIGQAQNRVKELEASRSAVVLSGASIADHARQLFEASERVLALTAARDETRERCDAAIDRERRATWEAWSKEAHEKKVPELAAALTSFYNAGIAFLDAAKLVRTKKTEISDMLSTIENAGPEFRRLLVSLPRVRAETAAKLHRPTFGRNVMGPLREDDSISVVARLVAETAASLGIHDDNRHRMARDTSLVSYHSTGPAGLRINEPAAPLAEGVIALKPEEAA